MDVIDLFSDTQTRPTAGMRAAMANAVVGDEQSDSDPTTLELCDRVARLLGKEAGVFLPSGTMCNLVSVLVHTRPGDEIICDRRSHLYETEAAGAAALAGASAYALASPHGVFTAAQVSEAIRPLSRTAPRSAMLSVEQSTNFSGGAIWPLDILEDVRQVAAKHGLKSHMDGARLLNACAATGIEASTYAASWDSVWIDLTKGLGCPVGAVLCGSQSFVQQAWQWKYRLGGAMRQSGVLAAAGIYALEHHLPQLLIDHVNAQAIWRTLGSCSLFRFDPPVPASNILRFQFVDARIDADVFARRCLERGVRVRAIGGGHVRVTTHLDVSPKQAQQAAGVMISVAEALIENS